MEPIILAAWLYAQQNKPRIDPNTCPSHFIKEYPLHKQKALQSLQHPCWHPDPAGRFYCDKNGCLK